MEAYCHSNFAPNACDTPKTSHIFIVKRFKKRLHMMSFGTSKQFTAKTVLIETD